MLTHSFAVFVASGGINCPRSLDFGWTFVLREQLNVEADSSPVLWSH